MSIDAGQPSKRPRDENFPVASLVLSREHRDAVLAFYGFARTADDIADAPELGAAEKLTRLDALEQALVAGDTDIPEAARLHAVETRHEAGLSQARDLLRAFRQDVVKARYHDWAELIDYCRLSANPVGRFLLAVHGERGSAHGPADALCTALQILNHLQDCRKDREHLGRIYIPIRWMLGAGSEKAFFEPSHTGMRRDVFDAMLDRVDALIDQAQSLPEHLQSRRLRAQSIATIALARRLSGRLRQADPVLERIQVSKADIGMAFLQGVRGTVRAPSSSDRHVTAAVVRRSGSSFRLGMQSLGPERRRAIHAVYAFCRAVDDIADGAAPASEKRAFLREWRRELDRLHRAPETPIGRELARASTLFKLPVEECHALLDGMETDSADRVRLAGDYELGLYGRRVAGSVGALSIRIFGVPSAHDFALNLGRTLQLVNILRDVDEDAACERVYIPLSRLAQLGLQDAPAVTLVADPRFARVCETLAGEARAGFADADAALARLDRRALKPAILMMENYRRVLDRLQARGWGVRQGRLRLSAADRLHLITRAMRPA
ncbi:squalene/phytoene synthase family protein [Microvirga terrae]|uniref:Squalene/phytoene synthase family protein n=1 Tax=Microvirga terrae TaxID=2740529 RepID=A0ABY5RS44_9HYPH|nr:MULTISPECIES: squalene/phytoene synthase family protein [Microvirga]MBQ0824095.1 squalene/phytoene synthase family protein [Microvirga sp. HBU67558]UVF20073.1 squalene/phytoene synthase family protein [Microvirga terrae]UWU44340.1 phytoene desaturase [Microvirga sp. SWF67558]